MRVEPAGDVRVLLKKVLAKNDFNHVISKRIFCFRSYDSKARARARIWAFPKIWQMALNLKPAYIIEVLAEKFDHLSIQEKERVIIHELTHIPKNFSGSLLPHLRRLFKHL